MHISTKNELHENTKQVIALNITLHTCLIPHILLDGDEHDLIGHDCGGSGLIGCLPH